VTKSVKGKAAYYACYAKSQGYPCRQRAVLASTLEQQVSELLTIFSLPSQEQARLIALYQDDVRRQQVQHVGVSGQDVAAQRTQLLARLERQQHLYELGDWTREQYLQARQATEAELDALPPTDRQTQQTLTPDALSQLGTYVRQIGYAYCDADLAQRRMLIRTLFSQFWVAGDRIVAVEPVEEFYPFFRLMRFRIHEYLPYVDALDEGEEEESGTGNAQDIGQEKAPNAERHGRGIKVQTGGPDGVRTRDLRRDRPAC
jgi:hypothetical protein